MALDPRQFMTFMVKRTNFSDSDKASLKANAEWGLSIASDVADTFYAYLGRNEDMNAILLPF